jgi:hypothetical protein
VGILHLMSECGLINAYNHIHDDHEELPTHINGSQTIDYMLGTENIMQIIHKMGYIKFNKCFDSEHRGIYCDLSSQLFQKPSPPSVTQTRTVGSNSTNAEGERYIRHLYAHLLSNNVFQKSKNSGEILFNIQLTETSNKPAKLYVCYNNQWNVKRRTYTVQKNDPVMWLPTIQQSNLRVKYWNIYLKTTRQEIRAHQRLKDLLLKMDDISWYMIRHRKKTLLAPFKQALKEHREITKTNIIDRQEYLQTLVDNLKMRND